VQKRFLEAVRPLEAYHGLQPTNPQASLFLGQAYAALGRQDDARKILNEGLANAERAGNKTTAQYLREMLQGL
jgi:Flp pilus assembly protein TadD